MLWFNDLRERLERGVIVYSFSIKIAALGVDPRKVVPVAVADQNLPIGERSRKLLVDLAKNYDSTDGKALFR